jgi:hypothetical protein
MDIGKFLLDLITLPSVISAIIGAVLALLLPKLAESKLANNILDMVIAAYEKAEEIGLAQGLKGYQKWDPFIDEFIFQYRTKYGTLPNPETVGKALVLASQEAAARKN